LAEANFPSVFGMPARIGRAGDSKLSERQKQYYFETISLGIVAFDAQPHQDGV
jgi:hypothetical protein